MTQDNNRLCIYHFYDAKGIVDDYVIYALKEFKKICRSIIVTSNTPVNDEGRAKFNELGITLMERSNVGFDFGGWKDAITKYVLDTPSKDYNELIITNDSYYGPFRPWSEIFDEMSSNNCDFWGLTHGVSYHFEKETIPIHIQSYFVVIRNKMLHSDEFKQYWEELPYAQSFMDCVAKCEGKFAKWFEDRGFKWDVYCHTNESKTGLISATYLYNSDVLCKYYKYPVIKKKTLTLSFDEIIEAGAGEDQYKVIDYIKNETNYDINLIWKNLLRLYSIDKLSISFPNYIILDKCDNHSDKKSIVIASLENSINIQIYLEYLNKVPSWIDLFVMSSNDVICDIVNYSVKRKVITKKYDDKTNVLTFLSVLEKDNDHEYFCYVHDTDIDADDMPHIFDYSNNKSLRNIQWDNLLHSENYINSITSELDNDHVGLLIPPTPYHDTYESELEESWKKILDDNIELIERTELLIQNKTIPENYSSMFWCKKSSFNAMLKENYLQMMKNNFVRDLDLIEFINFTLPYYIQKVGLFTYKVMNAEYAATHIRNFEKKYQKSISNKETDNSPVTKFFSRHGRIFKILSKFDKIFYKL